MTVRKAVCPGSFDPVTLGHLNVFERAAAQFDHVSVAVLVNQIKSGTFTVDERKAMLRDTTSHIANLDVFSFQGLLVDYCRAHDISVIVKGLRAVSDFDYELQMAQMNYRLAGIETMFVATDPEYSFLSSSLIKDIAKWGGDVSSIVPPNVDLALKAKFAEPGEH